MDGRDARPTGFVPGSQRQNRERLRRGFRRFRTGSGIRGDGGPAALSPRGLAVSGKFCSAPSKQRTFGDFQFSGMEVFREKREAANCVADNAGSFVIPTTAEAALSLSRGSAVMLYATP